MNIAILTHPLGSNYGGILQAYALSAYLKNMGHSVILLNRLTNKPFFKRLIRALMMKLKHPRYFSSKNKNLVAFVETYLTYSEPMSTTSQLTRYIKRKNVDAVIVGSDQVWRYDFVAGYGYDYFLDFVPAGTRRLSYAASFGLSEWRFSKEQTACIKHFLSAFSAVSVREDEGVKLCEEELGLQADHVLDPTMLLQPDDYSAITSPRQVNEDYVFIYWLGAAEEKRKALAEAQILKKKIIDISLRGDEPLVPVQDWLSYIKYADHVVTDSFHGCVFSILFQRPFTICSNNLGGNGRLASLLRALNIDATSPVQYNEVCERIIELREKSDNYLRESLA